MVFFSESIKVGTTLKNKGNHNGFKNQTFINEVGTTHKDVREKIDSFLYEMIKKEISESRVITGKSKKMKKIVSTICEDYGFKTLDEFNNSGSIIIS